VATSDGSVVDGHLRLKAARKLGIEEVPVALADELSDEQIKAFRLLANQSANWAAWDVELLKLELAELDGLGFDLALTGFDDDALAGFLADKTEGLTDPDEVPDVQEQAITVRGDTWLLGKHRLRCGDSMSATDIDALMNGERADLLFTSPPYAQQRDYGAAKEKVGDWDALMQGVFSVAPVKDGAQLLVNLGLVHREGEWLPYWDAWIAWMREAGWRRFGWYVWDQGPGLPGDWNGRLAPSHEFIFHFNRDARRANKTVAAKHAGKKNPGTGMRGKDGRVGGYTAIDKNVQALKIADSVFRVMRHKARGIETKHPAVFPVALVEEAFAAYSKEGDVVFEPFCGSGTQIIAAEKMGRHCFGSEMDPVYCDVAVRRWQLFTGEQATLEGDGRTFEEISEARYDWSKDSAASYDAAIAAKREQYEREAAE
jgi:DNA modification methylase